MQDIFVAIGVPVIIAGIIALIINAFFKDAVLFAWRKVTRRYKWVADPPLENKEVVKHISTYPMDYWLDFKSKRINGKIEGEKAFVQHLILFISTERFKYQIYSDEYGVEQSDTIYKEKNQVSF